MLLTGPGHPRQGFLDSLDSIVQLLRGQVFAPSTRATYRSQQRLYLQFCDLAGLNPVPLSQANACRYIAFLSQRLAYNSVKLYINVVRIMHLEAGHANPFSNSWIVDTLLKGTKRVLGAAQKQKLPITPQILLRLFPLIDFSSSFDVTFWAACLVAFFSFFRRSNLLVKSMSSFDPNLHLCRRDASFSSEGVTLEVRWSKTIQYRERVLHVPLPRIPFSPLCPSQALLLSLRLSISPNDGPLFTFSGPRGWAPLSGNLFNQKLLQLLARLNLDPSLYSGHSFRRGGASFALECGLPTEVIQAQGDWASNAYQLYVTPTLRLRRKLATVLGERISNL